MKAGACVASACCNGEDNLSCRRQEAQFRARPQKLREGKAQVSRKLPKAAQLCIGASKKWDVPDTDERQANTMFDSLQTDQAH